MQISWRKPAFDGGSPITDYIIERQEVPSTTWIKVTSVSSSKLTAKINYLIHGKEYRFRVSAKNIVGCSQPVIGSSMIMKSPFNGECQRQSLYFYYICTILIYTYMYISQYYLHRVPSKYYMATPIVIKHLWTIHDSVCASDNAMPRFAPRIIHHFMHSRPWTTGGWVVGEKRVNDR